LCLETQLDNAAYNLATTGFLGHKIKSKTDRLKHVQFPRDRSRIKVLMIQSVFCFNLLILILVWSMVRVRQKQGYYLAHEACRSITVEFGNEIFDLRSRMSIDKEFPRLLHYSYFSGEYHAVVTKSSVMTKNDIERPMYFERGKVDDPKSGKFYYCEDARSWVFTIPALKSVMKEDSTGMTCAEGWLAMSPMTETFKLEDVELTDWIIVAGSGTITTAKNMFLRCGECKRDSDCSLNGVCDSGSCICNEGWQGRVCNLKAPSTYMNHVYKVFHHGNILTFWLVHCIIVGCVCHHSVQGNG
jgi:hypothetical protein